MVALVRTRFVVDESQQFLQQANATGSAIESFITQHALVVMCAEAEAQLIDLAIDHGDRSCIGGAGSYIRGTVRLNLRSNKKADVDKLIGLFGEAIKRRFYELVPERAVATWTNACNARDDVAHRSGTRMTMAEVREALEATELLLDAFKQALSEARPLVGQAVRTPEAPA